MTSTPHTPLDTTIEKTNLVLKDIEEVYGWPKERRNQSYLALRVVLHAVRDRMTINEAAQFAAQLPLLIRGIFYEGWDPTDVPQKPSREEFLQRIRRDFRFVDVDGGMELLVQTVLGALRRYVTDGEWEDIRTNMPKDLATVLP
jgi:uncharacterized protein (DUF2267 family)